MIAYEQFVPDEAAERAVIRALEEFRNLRERQGRTDELTPVIKQGLAAPDPRYIYEHAAEFAPHHFVMLFAAWTGCVPLFRLRVEGLGDTNNLEFFIQQAAIHDAAQVIRYLVPHVRDINQREADGPRGHAHTALHWAVIQKSLDSVCALLEHPEIDLEVKDRHRTTALALAVRGHKLAIAERLLAAGAWLDPDLLVFAAGSRNRLLVDFALRHAPEPNLYGKQGITLLHAAVTAGDVEGTQRLLAAGADPSLPSRRKYTRSGRAYPRHSTAAEFARIQGDATLQALFV